MTNLPRSDRGLALVLLAALWLPGWVPARAETDADVIAEHETLDMPPGTPARNDPHARAPAAHVVFGSYESIQVNVDALQQDIVGDAANEPSIAINPVNPLNMVIGWRQFDTINSNFRQGGWAYTFDGGETWTFPGSLEPGVFRSDPVLDADSNGIFYYQSLKSDFTAQVFRSIDGGVTWLAPISEYGGDKNWFVVDRTGGPSDGFLYGIWQRFSSCCGTNVLPRSTNGGASFEAPVPVDKSPTFGTLAVGPDAELYAVGADGSVSQDLKHFVVSKSTNASNPSATPTFIGARVDLGGRMRSSVGPNIGGLLGQANVAVDASSGPTRGQVYLVAAVGPVATDPSDVHVIRSSDGGTTWSPSVRINDDSSTANWQWFAAHSVAPNGRIDVIWNDTRNSGQTNVSQLFYSYSWDSGASWATNVAVSPSFDSTIGYPQQSKIGDYSTIRSDETGAGVAYAATFTGGQDVYYVRVFPDCNGNSVSDVTDIAAHSSFDCDANHVPDECQATPQCIGAGGVPDGTSGVPLTIGKDVGGDLALAWGGSCRSGDADYAIYEGELGDFTSHISRFCTTGGQGSKVFTPSAADSYYLIVPVHADREGSYGTDSSGFEIPQEPGACFPQLIRTCQ